MNSSAFMAIALKVLGAIALVLINGFFVAAELALVKIRETQLDALVARGQRRARVARQLKNNLNTALSATQLGITLASLALGWFVQPFVQAALDPLLVLLGVQDSGWLHSAVFFLVFALVSFSLIIAGEMVPKAIALQKTAPVALAVALPLTWFRRLTFPFIWLINQTALWLLRWLGIQVGSGEGPHSEEELRLLLLSAREPAGGTLLGREIVLNALALRHRIAREVMRPRREIVCLNAGATVTECINIAERTRYSRFPLCEEGDLDRTLGVIHIKDLYGLRHKARMGRDLAPAARKLIYAPETARLESLLQLFLDRKLHLAIVVDEYGGTVGMVTLENILEELVGQIQDEFDQEIPLVVPKGEHTWEIDGILPLHELSDLVGTTLREEGITTTSGYVTQRLGAFPHPGDQLAVGNYDLRVEATDGLRITRLSLRRRTPGEPLETPNANPANP